MSPSRAPKTSATRSACSRLATNSSASAEAASSHCASSTTATTVRSSAASLSRLKVARKTANLSATEPSCSPNAPRSARACGAGNRSRYGSTGRSSRCNAANASGDSDSMPCVHNTCAPAARDDASDSSADLPTPGSPRTTTTPPRPAAASANKASSRALSEARPQSTRLRYPPPPASLPRTDPRNYTEPSLSRAAQAEPRRGSPLSRRTPSMSNAEHTRSLASAVPAPAHPGAGAGRTNDISESRTTAPATRRGHIGLIVVGSLATGLTAALLLVLVVFAGAAEPVVTGSAMLGFGLGWAMLAALSVWRTDQPQRWALVPAAYFIVTGAALLLLSPGDGALSLLGWAWPPLLLALLVWMVVRARQHLRSWTRPLVVYPVLVALALSAAGGAVETVAESASAGRAVAGRMVDVGGHRLYLACRGTGSPTVVLENGLGEHTPSWTWIVKDAALDTRVCVYDRAGQGWSESAAGPQDGAQVAADLPTLLARAPLPGPYLQPGHHL